MADPARLYKQTVTITSSIANGNVMNLKRVYYTDDDPTDEKLVGDGGTLDPGGASTVSLTWLALSGTVNYWQGDITVSGNYSLFVGTSATTSNEYFRNKLIQTGKEAEDVVLNNSHRTSPTGVHGIDGSSYVVGTLDEQTLDKKTLDQPAGILPSDINLGNVENKSASDINDEMTVTQVESLGFNEKNQSWIYQETWTTGAAETTKNIDAKDIVTYLNLATNWEVAPNVTIEFWIEATTGRWAFISKTNVSLNEKSVYGITVLDNVAITGLANSTRYRVQLVLASIEAPPV